MDWSKGRDFGQNGSPNNVPIDVYAAPKVAIKHTHIYIYIYIYIFPLALRPKAGQGFWITHNDAPHSVGLLRTRDRPIAETST